MMQAEPVDRLLRAALVSDEEFTALLNHILKAELRVGVRELSERSGIAQSTLYKVLNGQRSPTLSTLRQILNAVRSFSRSPEEAFIGLIAARYVLESIQERMVVIDGQQFRVREYPVHTFEDTIVAAVRAEREGAIAIVCAPIASSTIEQVIRIPVTTIVPRDSVQRAIEAAARKAWM
ncbi:helix-turn-helix domain-containing protein [Methanofollis fontis]|uniref:Transcriptional regulator n=1 Tax=Methanofollis fontis TaxID=2052832 RepID=A0A483CTM4_9EURY|nr:helix-turn-helix domain-containing protein [Methanofollis fontis]TAJ44628.1 transcriptional regulator [Methanofollis fontis]